MEDRAIIIFIAAIIAFSIPAVFVAAVDLLSRKKDYYAQRNGVWYRKRY